MMNRQRLLRIFILVTLVPVFLLSGCESNPYTETPSENIKTDFDISSVDAIFEWANDEAERMAIVISGEPEAPHQLKQNILFDLAAIRQTYGEEFPQIWKVQFIPPWATNNILFGLSAEGWKAFRNDEYKELYSLNNKLNASECFDIDGARIVVRFDDNYHPQYLIDEYFNLTEVTEIGPNRIGIREQIYFDRGDEINSYYFVHLPRFITNRNNLEFLYFTVDADHKPELAGQYTGKQDEPYPVWMDEVQNKIDSFTNDYYIQYLRKKTDEE